MLLKDYFMLLKNLSKDILLKSSLEEVKQAIDMPEMTKTRLPYTDYY